jgi:GNAT superfamily N-acetyltransferase
MTEARLTRDYCEADAVAIELRTQLPAIDAYDALFQTTGWTSRQPVTPEILALSLEKSWYCVFAYDGDELVGAGHVVTDGRLHAILYDVIVAPDHQHQGIGKLIVGRLVQKCLEAQIRTIQLFCAPGKQAFYEQLGFVARPADGPGMQFKGK